MMARKRAAREFVLGNIEHGIARGNVALLMPSVTLTDNGSAYVDVRIFVPEIDVAETMSKQNGEKP